jgi:hypothetical protein
VKVRVLHAQVVVAEDGVHRVELRQVERASRGRELGHDPRPQGDVGQPSEGAQPRVDDVEGASFHQVDGVVHVAEHELGRQARPPRHVGSLVHGRLREVDARHARSSPRPRQCVEAEVALRVNERLAGDVTDLVDFEGT